jgi:hypothetical protein
VTPLHGVAVHVTVRDAAPVLAREGVHVDWQNLMAMAFNLPCWLYLKLWRALPKQVDRASQERRKRVKARGLWVNARLALHVRPRINKILTNADPGRCVLNVYKRARYIIRSFVF